MSKEIGFSFKGQNLEDWVSNSKINFGINSEDYANFRPGPPLSFYDRIESITGKIEGKVVLDLACGPGTVTFDLVKRNPKQVIGVDIATGQIESARKKASRLGLESTCSFTMGTAEETGQPSDHFDLVIVSTAWHWFNAAKACAEIKRILKPGGYLVIVDYVYLASRSSIARDTEELVLKYNPTWPMTNLTGTHPHQIEQVMDNGLGFVEQFCYDFEQPFSHEGWRGRIRTCNGVHPTGTFTVEHLMQFDNDLKELLAKKYPSNEITICHRVWSVVAQKQ